MIFRGKPGEAAGWFDYFILDAARRLRTNPEFAAIWQAEQQSAVKALLAAQGRQLGDIAGRIDGLAAALERVREDTGAIRGGVDRIEAGQGQMHAVLGGLRRGHQWAAALLGVVLLGVAAGLWFWRETHREQREARLDQAEILAKVDALVAATREQKGATPDEIEALRRQIKELRGAHDVSLQAIASRSCRDPGW